MSEEQIETSLSYGGNPKKGLMFIVVLTIIMNIVLLAAMIAVFVVEKDFSYFYTIIIPLLFLVCFLIIFLRAIALKRCIKEWLKDAIELQCRCDYALGSIVKNNGDCKISVIFEYNGETHIKSSGRNNKNPFLLFTDGYNGINKKYIGRTFNILYSPKYDEIMIPKQEII